MQNNQVSGSGACYGWGGMVLAFVPASQDVELETSDHYRSFVTDAPPNAVYRVHRGPAPCSSLGTPLFESEGNWTLYSMAGKPALRIRVPGSDPHQIVILEPDFQEGDIYCVGEAWNTNGRLSPLGYPLEEVLTVNLLARGRGVLLHASAVRDGERGFLFSGVSGAGKSTMASLWEGRPGVKLLSDDRVIVREREGRFWAYGTPWHGSGRIASPERMPLDAIYVLRHASENWAVGLHPLDAASRLLVRSFPTFWDAEGMAFTLRFLADLCRTVPCHDLGFVPGEEAVEYLRCAPAA